MIGYLKGAVLALCQNSLVLDVHGVGYSVSVTSDLVSRVHEGQELSLFIHTAVREDAITLFGFESEEHLAFFKQLLTVSGIGPKTGLAIMSGSPDVVRDAIASGDEAMLTRIPGIGKKTAARIILDLKGKVVAPTMKPRAVRSGLDDACEALLNLGYDRGMIMKIVGDLPAEIQETEDIVKYFLKNA